MAPTPTRPLTTRRRGAGKRPRRRDPKPPAQPAHNAPPRGRAKLAAKGLYGYIWAISGSAQILLALLSIFIFLLDLVPLELQRRIVNDAIGKSVFVELVWLCGVYAVTTLAQGIGQL